MEGVSHACQVIRDMHDIFDWIELRQQPHLLLHEH
jgi:hypothetical protein